MMQTGNNSYTQVGAQAITIPTPNSSIQEANARLSSLVEELSANLDRMERIISRAFGQSTGKDANGNVPKPVPNGEIGALNERIEQLSNICSQQGQAISRLDSIV